MWQEGSWGIHSLTPCSHLAEFLLAPPLGKTTPETGRTRAPVDAGHKDQPPGQEAGCRTLTGVSEEQTSNIQHSWDEIHFDST